MYAAQLFTHSELTAVFEPFLDLFLKLFYLIVIMFYILSYQK